MTVQSNANGYAGISDTYPRPTQRDAAQAKLDVGRRSRIPTGNISTASRVVEDIAVARQGTQAYTQGALGELRKTSGIVDRHHGHTHLHRAWWRPSADLENAIAVVVKQGGVWCFFASAWLLVVITVGRAVI